MTRSPPPYRVTEDLSPVSYTYCLNNQLMYMYYLSYTKVYPLIVFSYSCMYFITHPEYIYEYRLISTRNRAKELSLAKLLLCALLQYSRYSCYVTSCRLLITPERLLRFCFQNNVTYRQLYGVFYDQDTDFMEYWWGFGTKQVDNFENILLLG